MVLSLVIVLWLPLLNLTGLSSRFFAMVESVAWFELSMFDCGEAERTWLAICAVRPFAATNGDAGAGAGSSTAEDVVSGSVFGGSCLVGDVGP